MFTSFSSKTVRMFKRGKTQVALWMMQPVMARRLLVVAFAALFLVVSPVSVFAQGAGNGLGSAFSNLAKTLINGIIIVASLLLAVGIATNFLTGMIETMAGRPGGLSTTWMRIAGIVLCFIGALFSILISNAIIDGVTGAGVNWKEDIKTP